MKLIQVVHLLIQHKGIHYHKNQACARLREKLHRYKLANASLSF